MCRNIIWTPTSHAGVHAWTCIRRQPRSSRISLPLADEWGAKTRHEATRMTYSISIACSNLYLSLLSVSDLLTMIVRLVSFPSSSDSHVLLARHPTVTSPRCRSRTWRTTVTLDSSVSSSLLSVLEISMGDFMSMQNIQSPMFDSSRRQFVCTKIQLVLHAENSVFQRS